MRQHAVALAAALVLSLGFADGARAQEEAPTPPHQQWSFNGAFGTYDRAALQRGFQVYKEDCAACHAVKHLYYRDLEELGYTEDQVKGIAAQVQVTDGPNDQGEMFQRPARPSDPIARPFANDQAARAANNGALPPDLSLITKAREGGADYVYAILTGFKDAPQGTTTNISPDIRSRCRRRSIPIRSNMPTAPRRRCRKWRMTWSASCPGRPSPTSISGTAWASR